mmetsp:Transcript_31876/g.104415  ORF Transcript_31876/g.104415 Transcript_31876/m.104415 type:complete len:206 (-) Transcript_31876:31-648(-)
MIHLSNRESSANGSRRAVDSWRARVARCTLLPALLARRRRLGPLRLRRPRPQPERQGEEQPKGEPDNDDRQRGARLHGSADADEERNHDWQGHERGDAGGAARDAEGPRHCGAATAQLHGRRELERGGGGGEEVVDAHDGLKVESDEGGEDDELEEDGEEGRAEARVADGEETGGEAGLRHAEELEGVLEQLGGEEAPVGEGGRG